MNSKTPIINALEKCYSDNLYTKVYEVYEVFKGFFGEEAVDLQNVFNKEDFVNTAYNDLNLRDIIDYSNNDIKLMLGFYPSSPFRNVLNIVTFNTVIDTLDENDFQTLVNYLNTEKFKKLLLKNKILCSTILVHFPHTVVTNEDGDSAEINHLYAKIEVTLKGTAVGRFLLNRSEYTVDHLASNYMHSHISKIPTNDFTEFQSPCLGTGPINDTILFLNTSDDLNIWRLFCFELSKYVTIESIAGRPYHYISNIGKYIKYQVEESLSFVGCFNMDSSLKYHFIKSLILQKLFRFNYIDSCYSIAMPTHEIILTISNYFINWYNEEVTKDSCPFIKKPLKKLIADNILHTAYNVNGTLYHPNNRAADYSSLIGKKVCTFKGKDVLVTIPEYKSTKEEKLIYILNPDFCSYLVTKILNIVNYSFNRTKNDTGRINYTL